MADPELEEALRLSRQMAGPTLPDGQWSCTACTFHNAAPRRHCELCDTQRPAAAAAVLAPPAAAAAAAAAVPRLPAVLMQTATAMAGNDTIAWPPVVLTPPVMPIATAAAGSVGTTAQRLARLTAVLSGTDADADAGADANVTDTVHRRPPLLVPELVRIVVRYARSTPRVWYVGGSHGMGHNQYVRQIDELLLDANGAHTTDLPAGMVLSAPLVAPAPPAAAAARVGAGARPTAPRTTRRDVPAESAAAMAAAAERREREAVHSAACAAVRQAVDAVVSGGPATARGVWRRAWLLQRPAGLPPVAPGKSTRPTGDGGRAHAACVVHGDALYVVGGSVTRDAHHPSGALNCVMCMPLTDGDGADTAAAAAEVDNKTAIADAERGYTLPRWRTLPDVPLASRLGGLDGAAAVVFTDPLTRAPHMAVLGGTSRAGVATHVLDLTHGEWDTLPYTPLPPLRTPRQLFFACAIGTTLYACSGATPADTTCEALALVPPPAHASALPIAVAVTAEAALADSSAAAATATAPITAETPAMSTAPPASASSYKPTWQAIAPCHRVHGRAGFVYQQQIWLMGENAYTHRTVEYYDPARNVWTALEWQLPHTLSSQHAVLVDGGGDGGSGGGSGVDGAAARRPAGEVRLYNEADAATAVPDTDGPVVVEVAGTSAYTASQVNVYELGANPRHPTTPWRVWTRPAVAQIAKRQAGTLIAIP